MTEENELTEAIGKLTGQIKEVADRKDAKASAGETPAPEIDGLHDIAQKAAAYDAALLSIRQSQALKDQRDKDGEVDERIQAAVKAALLNVRNPSMAGQIGSGKDSGNNGRRLITEIQPHPALKAAFREYQAGELMSAFTDKLYGMHNADFAMAARGKATLDDLGLVWAELPPESKATLGATGATGGYVLPNNLVDTLVKPATQRAVLQTLVTVRNGVAVRGVDQPYRTGAPTRMTFQDWGATKENVNEAYGSYTANLGTLARVYDISKQYARFSAGSAEQDVIDELGKAAILGENYYMIAGAGTGSTGTGDPTEGIYTAIVAASPALGYSKTPTTTASSSTLLGSFANILTQVQGQLAGRNREAQAYICDQTTYFTAAGQGSDAAGFWNAAENGPTQFGTIPGFGRTPSGGLTYWGVPVYYDTNLGTNATTKIVIGGEFSALKLYRGMEFRIDTSDQAGTRWDQNLIGFRGEEEIGFNALTAVNTGALQMYTSVIP